MAAAKRGAAKSTSKKTGSKPATRRPPQKKFLRNTTGVEFRIRLDRHGKDGRPLLLQPRGMRGDIAPLQKDDLSDAILLDNVALGYVELITEAEAKSAIHKQATNRQASHPALAALRTETGEEYPEGAVKVEEVFEDQGEVVATLDDGQVVFDRTGNIQRPDPTAIDNADANKESPIRNTAIDPAQQALPAGVAGAQSPGEAADALARNKNAQGPAAGLGGIKRVVVEPAKKSD